MLTNFRAKKELEKKAINKTNSQHGSSVEQNSATAQNATSLNALSLLAEAIDGVLFNNTQRVYINEVSFLADIKLPSGLNLQDLKKALDNKTVNFVEAKVVDEEMLVHFFNLIPSSQFEVWYKPLPRPRF